MGKIKVEWGERNAKRAEEVNSSTLQEREENPFGGIGEGDKVFVYLYL
jgi:hypothetical protein